MATVPDQEVPMHKGSKSDNAKVADALWLTHMRGQRQLMDKLQVENDNDFALLIRMVIRVGISQHEFGALIHKSQPTISRWHSGCNLPDLLTRHAVLDRVRKDFDDRIRNAT
jgi:hypothetical protein